MQRSLCTVRFSGLLACFLPPPCSIAQLAKHPRRYPHTRCSLQRKFTQKLVFNLLKLLAESTPQVSYWQVKESCHVFEPYITRVHTPWYKTINEILEIRCDQIIRKYNNCYDQPCPEFRQFIKNRRRSDIW